MASDGTKTETLSEGGGWHPRRSHFVEWALVTGMALAEIGAMACFLVRHVG